MTADLNSYFKEYMSKESLFINKSMLQSNYVPDEIPHRQEQIRQIAEILAPALREEKPSNLFIYGNTGTGKTLTANHTANTLLQVAKENNISLKILYVNCKLKKVADTEYRMIAQIIRELDHDIASTGLPTDEVYRAFFNAIEKSGIRNLIIILDEVDQLVKKAGDEALYNLTRMNEQFKGTSITIVGITNDHIFADNLDPRVKSSLSEEELLFPTYNAVQLKDILYNRVGRAIKPESIEMGVIEKCAAYAAKEHGDARRALDLLRVAAELAERSGESKIQIDHIDSAEEKIERDRIIDIVRTQPKQVQAALYAIFNIFQSKRNLVFTGEVYELYREVCKEIALRPLTQRRISDIIGELDMLGVIKANLISKGRYGRTKEITLATSESFSPKIMDVLREEMGL
ncbi:MAG: Cdc6/Cdc18 family protein [Candidatus Woesearchaeota archaeon]